MIPPMLDKVSDYAKSEIKSRSYGNICFMWLQKKKKNTKQETIIHIEARSREVNFHIIDLPQ